MYIWGVISLRKYDFSIEILLLDYIWWTFCVNMGESTVNLIHFRFHLIFIHLCLQIQFFIIFIPSSVVMNLLALIVLELILDHNHRNIAATDSKWQLIGKLFSEKRTIVLFLAPLRLMNKYKTKCNLHIPLIFKWGSIKLKFYHSEIFDFTSFILSPNSKVIAN